MYTQLYPLTKHTHKEPGWTTEESGFGSRQAKRFSVFQSVKTGCGAHPPPHQMATGVSCSREKQPGREADHSPRLVPTKRMLGTLNSSTPYVFMEWFHNQFCEESLDLVTHTHTHTHTYIYIYIYIFVYLYTTNDINRS